MEVANIWFFNFLYGVGVIGNSTVWRHSEFSKATSFYYIFMLNSFVITNHMDVTTWETRRVSWKKQVLITNRELVFLCGRCCSFLFLCCVFAMLVSVICLVPSIACILVYDKVKIPLSGVHYFVLQIWKC